jgi:FixJ family two-component response regulator
MIYVVDDDASIRKALDRLFRSAGLPVQVFASGLDFQRTVSLAAGDCLVMDLCMPANSSLAVQDAMGGRDLKIPLIAISARDDVETRARARALGASAFFRKPVDDQALLDAISWVTHN